MRLSRITAILAGGTLLLGVSACAEEAVFSSAVSEESDASAAGISIPANAPTFRTSALGPDPLNTEALEGTPISFVNPKLLDESGRLPEGMTVTEAQSLQVLEKVRALLADQKRKLYEVATIRVYLAPDGSDGVDFQGWGRAYRRYFANIDRDTGGSLLTEPVETTALSGSAPGTSARGGSPRTSAASPSGEEPRDTTTTASTSTRPPVEELYPGTDNRTRPTLVTVGVAQQPVKGWLVQVEIEVVHGED